MSRAAISKAIEAVRGQLADLSEHIWRHPELRYAEHKAHDALVAFARSCGFTVTPNFVHETGFKAEFRSGEGPHVLFISEYDALPSIGHACGHNLIATVGVAAGLALKEAMTSLKLGGRVTVLGTPAEEGGGGKLAMIEAGALDDVDAALMAHPYRLTASNVPHMALVGLSVKFFGKPSHAAQAPWEGHNALDAAVLAYQGVACLRQQVLPSCRIHGVITKGGEQPNIVPDFTEMEFYVRAEQLSELVSLEARVKDCFEAAARMTGCRVEIAQSVPMYANVLPNPLLAQLYRKHAAELGVARLVPDESVLSPSGSTDMGNVTQKVPGLHPMFYVGTEAALHSAPFAAAAGTPEAFSHALTQAQVLANIGADLLADPNLVAQTAAAFRTSASA